MTTLKIVNDPDPINPRSDDNLCLMVCEHGRYNLGDRHAKEILANKLNVSASNYKSHKLIDMAEAKGLVFMRKPIYMYDHSGITISMKPFSCPFDSGQVGEIIVLTETVKKEFGVKRITTQKRKEIEEKVLRNMEGEIETYDFYLRGDVFGFQILDEDDEIVDSCYGFYGDDFETNGIKDYIPEEFHENLKSIEVSY
jgi:hypothetical protein